MNDIKRIPVAEFRALGYLQEVNRLVLHPCGLALEVTVVDEEFVRRMTDRIEPLVRAELVSWGGVSEPDHLAELARGITEDVVGEFCAYDDEFISGVWDCRDDEEGILFARQMVSAEKAATVAAERERHAATRAHILRTGCDIQPVLCDACNVRPDWPGEHRCCGRDTLGCNCDCQEPLCRMQRGEVTLEELEAEEAQ